MPAKPVFTPAQQALIKSTAQRVFNSKFKWMKKTKDHPGGQEAMALALGITQQAVSTLLKDGGKYNPGVKVATAIANLDGQTLNQLIGEFGVSDEADAGAKKLTPKETVERQRVIEELGFANLDVCIRFHAGSKAWEPWTLAAARAGFFGPSDFPPAEWTAKLDALELILSKARGVSRRA